MKEMFEEYGGVIGATIGGVIMLMFLLSIYIPDSPIRKIVLKFLTITLPFSYH